MSESGPFEIRLLPEQDIPQAMLVERAGYEYPWSEKIFRDCLRVGYSCFAAYEGERVVGYLWLMMAADEGHILNVCTHPLYRSQGLARRLLKRCYQACLKREIYEVFLEVRPSNIGACHLYDTEGFHVVGERRGYYPAENNTREDAWIMAKTLFATDREAG